MILSRHAAAAGLACAKGHADLPPKSDEQVGVDDGM